MALQILRHPKERIETLDAVFADVRAGSLEEGLQRKRIARSPLKRPTPLTVRRATTGATFLPDDR